MNHKEEEEKVEQKKRVMKRPGTVETKMVAALLEPLNLGGQVAVSENDTNWGTLVKTFKAVSQLMHGHEKQLQHEKQPLVAVGGFAMFVHGDTGRSLRTSTFGPRHKDSRI